MTDYDPIAERYQRAKLHPWREHVEQFTLFELIGDLAGQSVLDLACGEGFHSRLLARRGARRVVGVDLSQRMVDLARAEEKRSPLGVEYAVGDARDLDLGERFDLVTAAYLLNYAQTRDELLAQCRTVVRHLAPGGRFVAANTNPDYQPHACPSEGKYGFETRGNVPLREGDPIVWKFFLEDGDVEVTNYHLSVATHDAVFGEVGLIDVSWHRPRLGPAGLAAFGQAYWDDLLRTAPVIFTTAQRAP